MAVRWPDCALVMILKKNGRNVTRSMMSYNYSLQSKRNQHKRLILTKDFDPFIGFFVFVFADID